MRTLTILLVVLTSFNAALANFTDSECDWILGKWKCTEDNPYSSNRSMFYNIILINKSEYRINLNSTKIPEANSYLGFIVYLDGRIDENTRAKSSCIDSKLAIDYLEDLQDSSSSYHRDQYEFFNDKMIISSIYYSSGGVNFSTCNKL